MGNSTLLGLLGNAEGGGSQQGTANGPVDFSGLFRAFSEGGAGTMDAAQAQAGQAVHVGNAAAGTAGEPEGGRTGAEAAAALAEAGGEDDLERELFDDLLGGCGESWLGVTAGEAQHAGGEARHGLATKAPVNITSSGKAASSSDRPFASLFG